MSEAVDALEAEATAGEEYVEVEFVHDIMVRVLPAKEWRASYFRALRAGEMDEFAELILHPEDVDTWYDVDPKQGEIEAFIERLSEETGEPVGKSPRSGRSSRNTRKK